MFAHKTFVVAALLTVAFFAGCIQAESAPPAGPAGAPGQPQVAAGPAEFDDTTGAVTGTVTTSELAPIPNAQVGILPNDMVPRALVVLTDESGHFTISHVPPGTHSMQTSALGFDAASKRVEVVAGAATTVAFVLSELPSEDPYMVTIYEAVQLSSIMYKLTPSCIYGTDYVPVTGVSQVDSQRQQAKTCGGLRFNTLGVGGQSIFAGCPACESHTATNDKYQSFNEHWQTIVGEATWQAQSGATGRGFLLDINAPNVTRGGSGAINQADPKTWYVGTDKPPIAIRVDKPTTLVERNIPEADWNNYPDGEGCTAAGSSNCDWFWRMFGARCDLGICDEGTGPDYGLLIESKAEVYFSYFIRSAAPEGFSALPDA